MKLDKLFFMVLILSFLPCSFKGMHCEKDAIENTSIDIELLNLLVTPYDQNISFRDRASEKEEDQVTSSIQYDKEYQDAPVKEQLCTESLLHSATFKVPCYEKFTDFYDNEQSEKEAEKRSTSIQNKKENQQQFVNQMSFEEPEQSVSTSKSPRILSNNPNNFRNVAQTIIYKYHSTKKDEDRGFRIKRWKCPRHDCNFATRGKYYLSQHLQRKHSEVMCQKSCRCEICGFKTDHQDFLLRHIRNMHRTLDEPKLFKCHIEGCKFETRYICNLRRHLKNLHQVTLPSQKSNASY